MANKYKKQLAILEVAARVREARKRMHEPFLVYQPWNMALDQYCVTFYPEGSLRKPEKYGPMTYTEVCRLLKTYPGNMHLQIIMSECAEWLYVFHHFSDHSKLYTEEQRRRIKARELAENPELGYLETECGNEMRSIMLSLPQTACVRLKCLQELLLMEE